MSSLLKWSLIGVGLLLAAAAIFYFLKKKKKKSEEEELGEYLEGEELEDEAPCGCEEKKN